MIAAGLNDDPRPMISRLNELLTKALEKHWPLPSPWFSLRTSLLLHQQAWKRAPRSSFIWFRGVLCFIHNLFGQSFPAHFWWTHIPLMSDSWKVVWMFSHLILKELYMGIRTDDDSCLFFNYYLSGKSRPTEIKKVNPEVLEKQFYCSQNVSAVTINNIRNLLLHPVFQTSCSSSQQLWVQGPRTVSPFSPPELGLSHHTNRAGFISSGWAIL